MGHRPHRFRHFLVHFGRLDLVLVLAGEDLALGLVGTVLLSGWLNLQPSRYRALALRPSSHDMVTTLDVIDRGLVGQVDGLADCTGDEGLARGHHADVAFGGDESLAELAALVGAIKNADVLGLEVPSASMVAGRR